MEALSPTPIIYSGEHTSRFRPRPYVVWTAHPDATVILDADRGQYYTLNGVAARIWELLTAGEPMLAILQALEDEYEIERTRCEADLTELLTQLRALELIEELGS